MCRIALTLLYHVVFYHILRVCQDNNINFNGHVFLCDRE